MKVEYADVPPFSFVEELMPLLPMHYDELCVSKEFPLDPDWDAYRTMAERGMLRTVTVRVDDALVGYMVFIVRPHLHYKSCLCAFEDLYYIRPDMRQGFLGIKMFKYAEQVLARIGVQRIIIHTKEHMDNSLLLTRLGYKPMDKIFTKTVEPQ